MKKSGSKILGIAAAIAVIIYWGNSIFNKVEPTKIKNKNNTSIQIRNKPMRIICYMHNPDSILSPMTFTLLPDDKTFVSPEREFGEYRDNGSWYSGSYKFNKFFIEWKINRTNGGIIYEASSGGANSTHTGDCELSAGKKF